MTRWRGCRLKSQKSSVRSTCASGSEVLDRVEIKMIGYSNTKLFRNIFRFRLVISVDLKGERCQNDTENFFTL